MRVADGFLLAYEALLQRTGQGGHVSSSVLELERAPDLAQLNRAAARVTEKHPLLVARLRRSWRTLLPYWEVPAGRVPPLPVGLWREAGSPGFLGTGAVQVDSARTRLESVLAESLVVGGTEFNAKLDVAELGNGRCLLALSWRHVLLDGKGAELLLEEIASLAGERELSISVAAESSPRLSLQVASRVAKPALKRIQMLADEGVVSLGGAKPRRRRSRFQVTRLSLEDSRRVAAQAEGATGALFPMSFYLACAARAHDRVLRHRRQQQFGQVISIPVQTRKRGARGPIFHNHVAIFFFSLKPVELSSVRTAALVLKQQFAEMSRAKLDESFSAILELMSRLPASLFMRVVRWKFKGEIGSFFHSHTGSFAPELREFAGAPITDAFHLPCVGTPPGTGIFFSERDYRLTITFSWREGCLSEEERRLWVGQTLEDAVGEPRPELIDAGL
ncbi:MAG TPA: hypothetical protein VF593_11150 [Chthoniobacteraceae bacterium]